jgi:hypothetical protein
MTSLLVFIALVVSMIIVSVLLRRLEKQGKIGRFSAGIGNALFQVDALIRPSRQHIIEARQEKKRESEAGDGGPPELPPWASSGS